MIRGPNHHMHNTIPPFVEECIQKYGPFRRVLEIGSHDVNGGIRDLFPTVGEYVGLDVREGPGVDLVADATVYKTDRSFDCVVSTEVFEHVEGWRGIVRCAAEAAARVFIVTCAGPGRGIHSATGGELDPDEWYQNVNPDDLKVELERYWYDVTVNFYTDPYCDVQACARGRLGTKVCW